MEEGLELGDVIGKETDQMATTVLQARRQNSLFKAGIQGKENKVLIG